MTLPLDPKRRLRVLVGKPGLDGHDRGARVVAMALRDAGMEVIYSGLRANVAQLAAAAVQEDVDVIGLSILSGAHVAICRKLREELLRRGAEIPLLLGGVIPAEDHAELRALGVSAIFGPETPLDDIVVAVRGLATGAKDASPEAQEPT
ncbi:MAG: cobalamin B12-binding domain-containing protein [Deltaproteobacteria bacterium]